MIKHYKCQGCANDMSYDAHEGMLTCPSCGRKENIEAYPENLIEQKFAEDEAKEYHCENCGADLYTLAETTATHCSFCGAGVVLLDRLSGNLAPALVMPFQLDQQEAQNLLRERCKKVGLTTNRFLKEKRLKNATGVYVPFWLYDLKSDVYVKAECTKVKSYTSGNTTYTETSYFDVVREIDLMYVKVPVDASEKMDDEMMDKLAPFDYEQIKPFKTPYLAGFIAEKYNYTDDEVQQRAEEKIEQFIESQISGSLNGYQGVNFQQKDIQTTNQKSHYTLMPVWMLIYEYNGKDYTFAINGQTGKVIGRPPLSRLKIAGYFSAITASCLVVFRSISALFLGGSFL